eukprot:Nk52_evm12s2640 gene=Nk52_evmTU12s2640
MSSEVKAFQTYQAISREIVAAVKSKGTSVGRPFLMPGQKRTGFRLYDLASKLPYGGLGYKFSKGPWSHNPEKFVTLSGIKIMPLDNGKFTGHAYGLKQYSADKIDGRQKVTGTHRKEWFVVDLPPLDFVCPQPDELFASSGPEEEEGEGAGSDD